MSKKIYDLMDWAAIEEIVYGEAQHPENLLGTTNVGRNTLVQCFFPDAAGVSLLTEDGENIKMEMQDEAGFFAALLPGKDRKDYRYHVSSHDKKVRPKDYDELYTGDELIKQADIDSLLSGSDYAVNRVLGSHVMNIGGKKGVLFAVWAPNAKRVSVVGDFNNWNGIGYQMIRNEQSGIYSLFIPGLKTGEKYKYEILVSGPDKILKPDPYALLTDETEENASIVSEISSIKWTDGDYLKARKASDNTKKPFNIYEINPEIIKNGAGLKASTKTIINHMKSFGYTHVDIMPLANYAKEGSSGYIPSSLFSINHRVGDAEDFMRFVNDLHEEGLGVILQMSVNCFDPGVGGISFYDGTCLYEHQDYRKGVDPRTGAKIFRFGEALVDEFVISNILFWKDNFHLDGIKFTDVSSMLYLDYYRNEGEWLPNIYGGNENLDAIKFIKKVNHELHTDKGFITIAEEKSGWPFISNTKSLSELEKADCLGFDFVMNNGFNEDVLAYIKNDPIDRSKHHDELTLSSVYQYQENYINYISHENTEFGQGNIIDQMYGDADERLANLKALYGYLMTMPGKKEFFMDQDDTNPEIAAFMKDMLKLVVTRKALSQYDYEAKGFEWINNFSANENVLVFSRKSDKDDEQLTIIVNFANVTRDKYHIGVPAYGKYREIINSDDKKYGGKNRVNDRVILAKKKECDARENSIAVKLAPLSIVILGYTAFTKAELDSMEKKKIAREKLVMERNKKHEAFLAEKKKIIEELSAEYKKRILEAEKKFK